MTQSHTPPTQGRPHTVASVPHRVLAAMVLGTILNPLNSSMVAVALVPMAGYFTISATKVTLIVSVFTLPR